MPAAFPGNSTTKLARAATGGGFESALEVVSGNLTASGVTGTLANDATITISALSAESFGGGPQISNMDDFRGGEGKHLQIMDNSDPKLAGDYYYIGPGSKYYTTDSHSGSACAVGIRKTATEGDALRLAMTTDPDNNPDDLTQPLYQDIFLSYWMRTPGPYLPYGQLDVTHPGPKTFPGGSNWKVNWLMQGDRGDNGSFSPWGVTNDVCLPSFINNALNTGNGGASRTEGWKTEFGVASDQDWWEWDHWQRMTIWLSDNNSSQFFLQKVSPGPNGYFSKAGTLKAPLNAAGDGGGMNALKFGGWHRDTVAGTLILFDDLYWAVGPNCAARIEIGDASEYSQCSELSICRVDSWSDTEITAKALFGALTPAAGQTIYVFNGLNQLVSKRTLQNA